MRCLKGFYSNYFGKKYFPSHYNQCPQNRLGGGGGGGEEGHYNWKEKGKRVIGEI